MMTHSLSTVSFRDPAGFVYRQQGDLLRQVNLVYREHYDRLMTTGLYEELVGAKLLIPHEELDDAGEKPGLAFKVIGAASTTSTIGEHLRNVSTGISRSYERSR